MVPPFQMFVCTYGVQMTELKISHRDLIKKLEPDGMVKVLNCNYEHKTAVGYEEFKKTAKKKNNPRNGEGDRTCLNSAIEPRIFPDDTFRAEVGIGESKKVYRMKCFPTTGSLQVTGVVLESLEDGAAVAQTWVNYLNKQLKLDEPIRILSQSIMMLNFKTKIPIGKDEIINMHRLTQHFIAHQYDKIVSLAPPASREKISFKYNDNKKILVVIFPSGCINIFGANRFDSVGKIHSFLERVFADQTIISKIIMPDILSDVEG